MISEGTELALRRFGTELSVSRTLFPLVRALMYSLVFPSGSGPVEFMMTKAAHAVMKVSAKQSYAMLVPGQPVLLTTTLPLTTEELFGKLIAQFVSRLLFREVSENG